MYRHFNQLKTAVDWMPTWETYPGSAVTSLGLRYGFSFFTLASDVTGMRAKVKLLFVVVVVSSGHKPYSTTCRLRIKFGYGPTKPHIFYSFIY